MVVAELLTRLGFVVDPRELNRGLDHARSSLQGFKSFLGKLALGVSFYEIGSHVVKTARELETMNVQLHTFTGNSERAQELFKGIVNYAKGTSYYVKDALTGVINLMGSGMSGKTAMALLPKLGDIASSPEQLSRLTEAYAALHRRGYMSGMELNRFLRGGKFAPLLELAKKQAEAAGVMRKGEEIEKGSAAEAYVAKAQNALQESVKAHGVTIQMVDEAIEYSTTKGGMFFEHQKNQLNTFSGVLSNMVDNLMINAGLATQKLFPIFKELMKAVTAIPFDWLSDAFENLAKTLDYLWGAMKQRGVLEAFQDMKQAFAEFAEGVAQAFGGGTLKGTLDNTASAATLVAKTFALLLRVGLNLALVVVRMVASLMDLWRMFRESKVAILGLITVLGTGVGLGLGAALWNVVSLSGLLVNTLRLLSPLLSRVALNFVRLGIMEGRFANSAMLLTRLGRVAQTIFPALLRFSAASVGGFIGLAGSVAFAASQFWELWKAYKGSEDAEEDLTNLTRRSEIATNKGLIQQKYNFAVEKGQWEAADYYHTALTRYEAQLAAFDKEHPQKGSPGAFEFQSPPELQAIVKQLEALNDNTDKSNEHLEGIKGNTTPKSGVPNDVLKLADMSFRTHFDVVASDILLAAE